MIGADLFIAAVSLTLVFGSLRGDLSVTCLLYTSGGTEKQYEKPLFRVVIVQCAAHCEAVPMVN